MVYNLNDKKTVAKAKDIVNSICKETGLNVHGTAVKARSDLYVLRRTKSKAILIECAFVDDADDKKLWNVNKVANGIVKGLL